MSEKKWIVLGTAGHIDHGKTSLVQALTGINTDRLKEEQERGITIELGFAYLDLPAGERVGIIDVPGHEKFVRHMVAGVAGMDAVMFIIAADEGIMPQTREHFDICRLLGMAKGLVVITKTDLVDQEWLGLIEEEVAQLTKGSFLEKAPIVPVSAKTGSGLPALLSGLQNLASEVQAKNTSGAFRLPIDRVFTIRGFGTVVTGTLLSGCLKKGMTVQIFPRGQEAKVRGLQVYNQSVEEAVAGQRTAVNLQGIETRDVLRGDVLSLPSFLQPTYLLDTKLYLLSSANHPLKNRTRVRFHTGTSEVLARVILLDREELEPGQETFVQFQLERALAVMANDQFVVRSYSPVMTIAGGRVIDNLPKRHKRYLEGEVKAVRILDQGDDIARLEQIIRQSKDEGIGVFSLETRLNRDYDHLLKDLQSLQRQGKITLMGGAESRAIHQEFFQALLDKALNLLSDFHGRFPLKAGMSKEELKVRLSARLDGHLYTQMLNVLAEQGKIALQEKTISLASHTIILAPEEEKEKEKILRIYYQAGFQPPNLEEVKEACRGSKIDFERLINFLLEGGSLVKIKEELLFHQEIASQVKEKLEDYFKQHTEISVAEFKDLLGFSRKYAIALLEYFDTINLTLRVGDKRVMKKRRSAS